MSNNDTEWMQVRKDGKPYFSGRLRRREKRFFINQQGNAASAMEEAFYSGMADGYYGHPANNPYPLHAKRRHKIYDDGYQGGLEQRADERATKGRW